MNVSADEIAAHGDKDSAVLPLSAVLSGVAALAGVVCFLSFLDAACFALSGVVSWFCCATVNGIASTAKRRTVRILMRVSGEKSWTSIIKGLHYCAWKTFAQRSTIPLDPEPSHRNLREFGSGRGFFSQPPLSRRRQPQTC